MAKPFSLNISIPIEHPVFAGHFPGDPLVPGALLMQWVFDAIEAHDANMHIKSVKTMKFINPVRPGQKLLVRVEPKPDQLTVECLDATSTNGTVFFAKAKVCI